MIKNGLLIKFALLKFHLFNDAPYVSEVHNYTGGPVITAYSKRNETITLGASSTQIIFLNQTLKYTFILYLNVSNEIHFIDLIDLFEKVKVINELSLGILNEYIKGKKSSK